MEIDDVATLLAQEAGVRRSTRAGRAEFRYHGRLVARQLDGAELVIRAEIGVRDALVHRHPATFHVPRRYERHMMVVADLADGDASAIEDALMAAVALQRRGD